MYTFVYFLQEAIITLNMKHHYSYHDDIPLQDTVAFSGCRRIPAELPKSQDQRSDSR